MSNTIHIKKIETGLEKVRELGHASNTFQVCGHTIGVRTLSRPQLREINLYCKPYLEDAKEQDTTFAMTDWMQKVREETLAHAIVQLDDIDLRGVDFVQMEDVDGELLKKQKHVIVREILQNWANSTLSVVYDKFREVVEKADENLQDSVDLETDAGRVSRIKALQKKVETLKKKVPDAVLEKEGLLVEQQPSTQDGENSEHNEWADANTDQLKERMFSPVEDDTEVALGKVAPRSGDEEASVSEAEQEYHREQEQLRQQHDPEVGPQKEDLTYVDEFGNPLTGNELQAAKAQDELLTKRRQQKEEASAQSKKRRRRPQGRRQPLNKVNADVKNQKGQPKTVRSNKTEKPKADEIVSSFDSEPTPLRRKRNQGVDWDQVSDPKPSTNRNPDFQPPTPNSDNDGK